jgi:heme/copper-type cytochrome/quinol oxidase subunit 2
MLQPVGQERWWAISWVTGICLSLIVWFIINVLLCVWIYRDAESRGMNGALWLIIVFISGIIGLIVYLIVRGEKTRRPSPYTAPSPVRKCPYCGREIDVSANFCPYCGNKVST